MRWKIEIDRAEGDPRLLRDMLTASGFQLIEEVSKLYLAGASLEALDTPQEVRKAGDTMSRALFEATTHAPEIGLNLSLRSMVIETTPGGELRHHGMKAETGVFNVQVLGGLHIQAKLDVAIAMSAEEAARLAQEQKEREYQALLRKTLVRFRSAQRSEDAIRVQRLLNGALTPLSMGHIAEILKGNGARPRASKRKWSRFDTSINHPSVFGDAARHGHSNETAPTHPMTLKECQDFIRAEAENWLEQVAS